MDEFTKNLNEIMGAIKIKDKIIINLEAQAKLRAKVAKMSFWLGIMFGTMLGLILSRYL